MLKQANAGKTYERFQLDAGPTKGVSGERLLCITTQCKRFIAVFCDKIYIIRHRNPKSTVYGSLGRYNAYLNQIRCNGLLLKSSTVFFESLLFYLCF